MNHGLGLVPDPQDKRDLIFNDYLKVSKTPQVLDWTNPSWPILDQEKNPHCVGFSGAAMKTAQELLEHNEVYKFSGEGLYRACKERDNLGSDGTYIRVLMKFLRATGALWRDKRYKIDAYLRLHSPREMELAITSTGPVVCGIEIFPSSVELRGGCINLPEEGEESLGGHAVLIVGYDKNSRQFKILNSWGKGWGNDGYCLVNYDFIQRHMHSCWAGVDQRDPVTQGYLDIKLIDQRVRLIDASNRTL